MSNGRENAEGVSAGSGHSREASNLAKRLLYFIGILLFVLALSMVSLLNKYDSREYRADVDAFNALTTLNEGPCISAVNSQSKRRKWLKSNHPEYAAQNQATRKAIVKALVDAGIDRGHIDEAKRRRPASFSAMEYVLTSEDEGILRWEGMGYVFGRIRSVSGYLDRLNALHGARQLSIAIAIEDHSILTDDDPNKLWESRPPSQYHEYLLHGFHLKNGMIHFDLEIPPNTPDQGILNGIDVSVKTKDVQIPSIAHVTEINGPLANLHADARHKQGLRTTYGNLGLEEAKSIAFESSVESHKRVKMFGFSFSTRRFPLALLAVLLLVATGNLITLRQAEKGSLRVISGVASESPFDILLDCPTSRFLIWTIIPVFALWASWPPYALGRAELWMVIGGGAVASLLGVWAWFLSRRL